MRDSNIHMITATILGIAASIALISSGVENNKLNHQIKSLNEEISYQQSIIDSLKGDCITLKWNKEE